MEDLYYISYEEAKLFVDEFFMTLGEDQTIFLYTWENGADVAYELVAFDPRDGGDLNQDNVYLTPDDAQKLVQNTKIKVNEA